QTPAGGVSPRRPTRAVRQRGAGPGGDPRGGRVRRRPRRRAGGAPEMTRGPRWPTSPGLGFAGTLAVHGAAVLALVGASSAHVREPPTYAVHLVAGPDVAVDEKRAPDAISRPAEEQPAPAVPTKPAPKHS